MLESCSECGGLIPTGLAVCPNCSSKRSSGRFARRLLAGGACAVTLMACYGVPYQEACAEFPDADGDSFCGEFDCDEADPTVHRWADDTEGNGVDENCDGADGTATDAGSVESDSGT